MIDTVLLRQLGWSNDLIQAVLRVAEPLRNTPTAHVGQPQSNYRATACSAVYADAVMDNTAKVFEVPQVAETSPLRKAPVRKASVRKARKR